VIYEGQWVAVSLQFFISKFYILSFAVLMVSFFVARLELQIESFRFWLARLLYQGRTGWSLLLSKIKLVHRTTKNLYGNCIISIKCSYFALYISNRGYYMGARRYEIYLRVLKKYLTSERSERVRYFQHEKINSYLQATM